MNSSTVLILGGVGAAGLIGFLWWRNTQSQIPMIAGPGQPMSSVNPNLLTQPSQAYPSQYGSGQVQRQDTASQPWYGGPRPQDATAGLVDQNFIQNVNLAKGSAEIVSSLTSIWDDLNLGSIWNDDGSYFQEDSSGEDISWDWGNIA